MHSFTLMAGLLVAAAAFAQVATAQHAPTYDEIKSRLEPFRSASDDDEAVDDKKHADDHEAASKARQSSEPGAKANDQEIAGSFYVDRLATTRALERSLLRFDALLLAGGHAELSLGFQTSRRRNSYPMLAQDEADMSLSLGKSEWQTETSAVRIELQAGLPFRSELDLSIPFNSVRASTTLSNSGEIIDRSRDTESGFGDVRLTLLKSVFEERGYRPDIIVFASVDGDTASDTEPATGSGATETTFGLNAAKRQDPLVFTAGIASTLATRAGSLRIGTRTRFSAGAMLGASPRTFMSFQYSQVYTDGATLDGQELTIGRNRAAFLTIGASSLISQYLMLSGEITAALTTRDTDYSFNLVLSRRFDFFSK